MTVKAIFPTFSGIIGYIQCERSSYHSGRKMDEQQAIQRLKRGDIGGLEIFVNVYQVRAVRTAYLITRDVALAEDVVQDAFLQTYRSIRHFDQDRPFGPWFMRSVVNAAVKAAQKTARQVPASPASEIPRWKICSPTAYRSKNRSKSAEIPASGLGCHAESLSPPARRRRPALFPGHERKRDGRRTRNCPRHSQMAAPCCTGTPAQPAFGKDRKMKDESIRKSLETIARRNIPENINLWPRLAARLERKDTVAMTQNGNSSGRSSSSCWACSSLPAWPMPLDVLPAIIPGIGFVQTSSLRVLAEPVSQTRDGITVTIEQVIVDSERTVVVYKTEGLTIAAANSKGEGGPFGSTQLLRLPDGTLMEETQILGILVPQNRSLTMSAHRAGGPIMSGGWSILLSQLWSMKVYCSFQSFKPCRLAPHLRTGR